MKPRSKFSAPLKKGLLLLLTLGLFAFGQAQDHFVVTPDYAAQSISTTQEVTSAPKIGWKKGWDQEKVLAFPKGERPAPSEYLKDCYIKKHLKMFESKAGGSSYFVPQSTLQKYGCNPLGRSDGQFVLPYKMRRNYSKKQGETLRKLKRHWAFLPVPGMGLLSC